MTPSATSAALVVMSGGRAVGDLTTDDSGRLSFVYSSEWLGHPSGFPISISLPLRAEPYVGGAGHAFFTNLLPEGDVRQAICSRLGISADNDFALLRALGGECAGALTIADAERPLPDADDERYEALDDRQLQNLVTAEDAVPLLVGGSATRLSLAGAHEKIPVAVLDGTLHLAYGGAPTTHIIKLPHRRYSHLPVNEAFVMGFARRLDFEAVAVKLYTGTDPPSLLVERYDRAPSRENWPATRLHQEDLCQALGLPAARKYEQEGGPSLRDVVRVLREHVREPLVDVRRVIEWQVFNLIAGNSDGHGKNLSLLYTDARTIQLAPFYDLVSTRHYQGIDPKLAMAVGGRRNPDEIGRSQWDGLAAELGVAARTIRRLVLDIAERSRHEIDDWSREFRDHHGAQSILQTLPAEIAKRAARVQEMAS